MKTTDNMVDMLKKLDGQAKAAVQYPGAYSADLWIGTSGAPKHTCEALIRRGLATETPGPYSFRSITINDAGRAFLAAKG